MGFLSTLGDFAGSAAIAGGRAFGQNFRAERRLNEDRRIRDRDRQRAQDETGNINAFTSQFNEKLLSGDIPGALQVLQGASTLPADVQQQAAQRLKDARDTQKTEKKNESILGALGGKFAQESMGRLGRDPQVARDVMDPSTTGDEAEMIAASATGGQFDTKDVRGLEDAQRFRDTSAVEGELGARTLLKGLAGPSTKRTTKVINDRLVDEDGVVLVDLSDPAADMTSAVDAVMKNPHLLSQFSSAVKSELIPRLHKAGFQFPVPMSDAARTKLAEMDAALSDLSGLEGRFGEAGVSDKQGPIVGLWTGNNPWDDLAQDIQAEINGVRQTVGKSLEGGVLREHDEQKYKKILPTLRDTPEVARRKIAGVMRRLQNARAIFHTRMLEGKIADPERDMDAIVRQELDKQLTEADRAHPDGPVFDPETRKWK